MPRQCGIATFTTHLADALDGELADATGFVLAMNDTGRRHAYPDTSVALAKGSVNQLLDWLDREGSAA